MDREHIEQEIRRQGINLDNLSYADRQSLVATREREVMTITPPKTKEPVQPPRVIVRAIAPKLPPAETPETELRQQLWLTQSDYKKQLNAVAELRVLGEQATERLGHAQAELHRFDDLEQRLAAHEVESLRNGEDAGLPRALHQQIAEHRHARDRADRAALAVQQIAGELSEATNRLAAARARLGNAVAGVAVCAARQLVAELDDIEAKAHALRQRIASLQLAGQNAPDDLQRRCFAPLPPIKRDPAQTAAWQAFQARLRSDAAAKLASPEE